MKTLLELQDSGLAEYFYKLAERSQDIFWIKNAEYTAHLYISPAYELISGYTCQSLYDNPQQWVQTIYTEDRERMIAEIQRRRLNPRFEDTHQANFRILRPDQTIRWIEET